jgi:3-oxoacyl-[acyl-carrier-protein] synthase II
MGIAETVTKHNISSVLHETDSSINDLAFIIPHGSGTRKGDRSELRSLTALFEDHKSDVPLCGLKPYTGHMGAASDITEIIFGINAAADRMVPATLNFQQTEKEFSDLKISGSHQACEKNKFLSISYGVGGQSSSVIVEIN